MVWALALPLSYSEFGNECECCGLRLKQALDLTLLWSHRSPAVNHSQRQLYPKVTSKENKARGHINSAGKGSSAGEGTAKQNLVMGCITGGAK